MLEESPTMVFVFCIYLLMALQSAKHLLHNAIIHHGVSVNFHFIFNLDTNDGSTLNFFSVHWENDVINTDCV